MFYQEGKSEKHLKDIKALLKNSKDKINFQELNQKIEENSLNSVWNKIEQTA